MTERAQALPLPRIKKRHPRPPAWWIYVAVCVFFAAAAILFIALNAMPSGAGAALCCAADWRALCRWPEDSARPAPWDTTTWALNVGGLALIWAGTIGELI
jgi:hypothetical protein